eukprot:6178380-Pleurochrysis_carterae.AAC.4
MGAPRARLIRVRVILVAHQVPQLRHSHALGLSRQRVLLPELRRARTRPIPPRPKDMAIQHFSSRCAQLDPFADRRRRALQSTAHGCRCEMAIRDSCTPGW